MEINNKSTLSMDVVTISGQTVNITKDSNVATTNNLSVEFTKVLTSTKEYILENETLVLTTTLTNGSAIELQNIGFKMALNTALSFVAGSVIVDDTPLADADIITGITLDNMAAAAEHVIKFSVTAVLPIQEEFGTAEGTVAYTIQDPTEGEKQYEENTNHLDLEVINADITIVNSVNKSYATKGNTLHYSNLITNGATSAKTNLNFINNIPESTTFVAGSVKVGGVEKTDFNPTTGFALDDLAAEGTVTVEFDVTVN